MSRKEEILTNAPIGQWVSKTNLMSDYIGDLDELESDFGVYDSNAGKTHDSNIVSAINFMWETVDSINSLLSTGNLLLKNIIADSGTFRIIRAGLLVADSATIDSASIANLTVTGVLDVDSGKFNKIDVNRIHVDDGANLIIDSAIVNRLHTKFLTTDSATITKVVAKNIDADSATIDSAFIDHLTIGQTLTFDNVEFRNSKLLTVKNETGTVVLSGYFLSTSSTPGTP